MSPVRPLRPCTQSGCPTLTNGGPCVTHKRAREQRRGSASSRGFGRRQKAWRDHMLSVEQERGIHLCHGCNRGPQVFADHVIPVPPGNRDAGDWSDENGQMLCPSCDGYKRRVEQFDPTFGPRLRAAGVPKGWRKLKAFGGDQ